MEGNIEINNQMEFTEVIISPCRPNKWIFIGMILFIAICFFLPIIILFFQQLDIGVGYILTLIIFWGTATYFLRQLLCNFFGIEKFVFRKNRLLHFYDYRLFKDCLCDIEFKRLKLGYIGINYPDKIFLLSKGNTTKNIKCYLVVIADECTIESPILILYKQVDLLFKHLIEK